ncbi:MAG: site-2 protease family protein [bacterium]
MIQFLITVVVLIAIFGLLVFVHEGGHFLISKRAGVLIDEFAFGFGPKLFGWKYRETEYRINLFPLGGYVKMAGDQDGSSLQRIGKKHIFPDELIQIKAIFSQAKIDLKTASFAAVEEFVHQQKGKVSEKELALLENYFAYYYFPKHLPDQDLQKIKKIFQQGKIHLKTARYEVVRQYILDQEKLLNKGDYTLLSNYFAWSYFPQHPGNYDNVSFWNKMAIMVGGVTMNLILAIVIFAFILPINHYLTVFPYLTKPVSIGAITNDKLLQLITINNGDQELKDSLIISIDNQVFTNQDVLEEYLQSKPNQELGVKLLSLRKGKFIETKLILNGDGIASNLDLDAKNKVFIADITKDSPAALAKIKPYSMILRFNGVAITSNNQISQIRDANVAKTIDLEYFDFEKNEIITAAVAVPDSDKPILGISMVPNDLFLDKQYVTLDYSDHKWFSPIAHTININCYNFQGLAVKIAESVKKKSIKPVSESVGSVVTIAYFTNDLVKLNDFMSIINLTAFLSSAIAIMNILPIPLLDGGHVMFLILEKLRGKPLSASKQEKIAIIAFWGIMIFSLLIIFKDIFYFQYPSKLLHWIVGLFQHVIQ